MVRTIGWRALTAHALVGAALLVACGGGEETADAGGPQSTDGILTVGRADAEVSRADTPDDLVAAAGDRFAHFTYEVGPDGSTFGEPVTIEFVLDAEDLGIDAVEAAHPALVVATDGDGTHEALDTEARVEGGRLVVTASTDHFSRFTGFVDQSAVTLATFPPGDPVDVAVGEPIVAVVAMAAESPDRLAPYDQRFSATAPVAFEGPARAPEGTEFTSPIDSGSFVCTEESDGVVAAGVRFDLRYTVRPTDTFPPGFEVFAPLIPPQDPVVMVVELSADVMCRTGAAPTTTAATTTTVAALPPGQDPEGDQETFESVPAPAGEGEPGTDIVRVSHTATLDSHRFRITMAGEGASLVETDTVEWITVILRGVEPDGTVWETDFGFFGPGEPNTGPVRHPDGRGEGATVTAMWVDPGVMEVTVTPGAQPLEVDTFEVEVGVSIGDGDGYWDRASGVAGD